MTDFYRLNRLDFEISVNVFKKFEISESSGHLEISNPTYEINRI